MLAKKNSTPHDYFIVTQVIAGDTLILDNGKTIRLIGAAAPKAEDKIEKNGKIKKPNSIAKKWADESIHFTEALVLNQPVWLEYDDHAPADPAFTWAYVYFKYPFPNSKKKWEWNGSVPVLLTPGRYMLNRMLVQYGYATENSPFNFKFRSQFSQLEQEARAKSRGLWMSNF